MRPWAKVRFWCCLRLFDLAMTVIRLSPPNSALRGWCYRVCDWCIDHQRELLPVVVAVD